MYGSERGILVGVLMYIHTAPVQCCRWSRECLVQRGCWPVPVETSSVLHSVHWTCLREGMCGGGKWVKGGVTQRKEGLGRDREKSNILKRDRGKTKCGSEIGGKDQRVHNGTQNLTDIFSG